MASPWVVGEVARNLVKFPAAVTADWLRLRHQLVIVDDVVSLDRTLIFPVSKDRPVLLSALASAQGALLTLDREDFMGVLGAQCYGLPILLPYDFLERERAAGRHPRSGEVGSPSGQCPFAGSGNQSAFRPFASTPPPHAAPRSGK